jgi:hypothetical protein
MRTARHLVAALVATGLLTAGCSSGEQVESGGTTTSTPSAEQRYEADATVLEGGGHGPQLCLGGIETSYPPQCGGPDVVGWDWDAVTGEESAIGTTWGSFHVVGTYVDGTFTLVEPASAPSPPADEDPTDFTSPCDPPAGGWAVVDPATTTDATLEAAQAAASAQPDHAGSWVDQSINLDRDDEASANDPTRLVLVVRFTGDLARHEQELRAIWGGALCVTGASRTQAELSAVQQELTDEPGFLWSSIDVVANAVDVGLIVDAGAQDRLDARYGTGVVRVEPGLHPVEG